ncbi:MAG: hypothetical protein QM820_42045 [Minicystis sp.]
MCNPVIAWIGAAARRRGAFLVLAAGVSLFAGCAAPEEDVGAAAEAAMNPNAMNPNAMNPNALSPSALRPSALAASALDPGALAPDARAALVDPGPDGDLSRELLRYAVSCALGPDQSFTLSWTDAAGAGHVDAYPGLLGLAPSWSAQALDATGRRWVSACLASRVNAEGASVMLSSRGAHAALATTSAERAAYPIREAVFFGDVFTESPRVYACHDPLSILPAQMAQRVCAQPELLRLTIGDLSLGYDCGSIEVLGPCTRLLGLITVGFCSGEAAVDRYLYGCAPPGSAALPSITTFLQGPIPW